VVCDRSAYPPTLSIIADILAPALRANSRREQVQQKKLDAVGTLITERPPHPADRSDKQPLGDKQIKKWASK